MTDLEIEKVVTQKIPYFSSSSSVLAPTRRPKSVTSKWDTEWSYQGQIGHPFDTQM